MHLTFLPSWKRRLRVNRGAQVDRDISFWLAFSIAIRFRCVRWFSRSILKLWKYSIFSFLSIWNIKIHNTIINTNNSKDLINAKIHEFFLFRFICFEIVYFALQKKMKFFIRDFFSKCDQIRKKNGKKHFEECSGRVKITIFNLCTAKQIMYTI